MGSMRGRSSGRSRRTFLGQVASAGTALGAGLVRPASVFASRAVDDDDRDGSASGRPNPIPGGVAPFAPFGIFIHHNPLNPANPLTSLNDPSQLTDFNGLVGLTHIRGGGTGTDTATGVKTALAFQADMGFSRGTFIGSDGRPHESTFTFV